MMAGKKKFTGQKAVDLVQAKEAFLILCEQYNHMGLLLSAGVKGLAHPMFTHTAVPLAIQRVLEQHKAMGDQLKHLGKRLDGLGGDPVLEKKTTSFTKPKLKKEPKDPNEGKTFVSNIPPKGVKDEKVYLSKPLEEDNTWNDPGGHPGEVSDTMPPVKPPKKEYKKNIFMQSGPPTTKESESENL